MTAIPEPPDGGAARTTGMRVGCGPGATCTLCGATFAASRDAKGHVCPPSTHSLCTVCGGAYGTTPRCPGCLND